MGDRPVPLVTLRCAPIPLARDFKQLGGGIHLDAKHGTGPVLRARFEQGRAILLHAGCMPTFHMREVAMYNMELATLGEKDLAHLELKALRVPLGPTRISRVREVLVLGHRVSALWRLTYACVLWLACTPGARQVLVQAVVEEMPRPPMMGRVGRSMQAV